MNWKQAFRVFVQSFAKTILENQTCKNCKWWANCRYEYLVEEFGCTNELVNSQVVADGMEVEASGFDPEETFGCNQWKKRE